MQLERQPLAGSGATTAQPSWRVQRASLDDAHSEPKPGTQPAAEPFLTFTVPDDLFARLDKLSSEQRRLLPELVSLCIPGQAGPRWLQYVTQPRALVQTRPTPAGDEFQGMRTMLMMPWQGSQALSDFTDRQAWRAAVTVLGISLHRRAAPADSGQPRLFAFEAARLPGVHLRPTPHPQQVMSFHSLLPSWLAAPFKEAMSRRRRREVTPLQQRQFARLERLLEQLVLCQPEDTPT